MESLTDLCLDKLHIDELANAQLLRRCFAEL